LYNLLFIAYLGFILVFLQKIFFGFHLRVLLFAELIGLVYRKFISFVFLLHFLVCCLSFSLYRSLWSLFLLVFCSWIIVWKNIIDIMSVFVLTFYLRENVFHGSTSVWLFSFICISWFLEHFNCIHSWLALLLSHLFNSLLFIYFLWPWTFFFGPFSFFFFR